MGFGHLKTSLAAALLLGAATPALAAENLDCIANRMTDAQRDSIYASEQANEPISTAIIEIIGACARAHGWSEAAFRQAFMHTFSSNMRRGMIRNAPVDATQMRAAEAAFDSVFTEAQARDMLVNNMSNAASERLGRALAAAGMPSGEGLHEWLGGYLAATQMEKYSRVDFAGA
jgi:hypothetical protein